MNKYAVGKTPPMVDLKLQTWYPVIPLVMFFFFKLNFVSSSSLYRHPMLVSICNGVFTTLEDVCPSVVRTHHMRRCWAAETSLRIKEEWSTRLFCCTDWIQMERQFESYPHNPTHTSQKSRNLEEFLRKVLQNVSKVLFELLFFVVTRTN